MKDILGGFIVVGAMLAVVHFAGLQKPFAAWGAGELQSSPPVPSDCILQGSQELGGSGAHSCNWVDVSCPVKYDYCYVYYRVYGWGGEPSGYLKTVIKQAKGTVQRYDFCSGSDSQTLYLNAGYCSIGSADVCMQDVAVCPDGTVVSRNPSDNCDFYPCPEPSQNVLQKAQRLLAALVEWILGLFRR